MSQSIDYLHQKLENILTLFSKAGISVVEFRDYGNFIDLVLDHPIENIKFKTIYAELLKTHRILAFQLKSITPVVRLVPYTPKTSFLQKYKLILTLSTVLTVFLTGFGLAQGLYDALGEIVGLQRLIIDAVMYTVVFLVILVSHEFGHLITSRKSHIEAEGPILIPAPPIQLGFIGTLGAVIFTKSPPSTRRDLAKLGLSGPLSGFIAATLMGIVGLYLSPVVPANIAETLVQSGKAEMMSFSSLMFNFLLLLRPTPDVLFIHPVLFASYIMYMVTFLNLLPIGQLDGGHVVRSVTSDQSYKYISTITPFALIMIGVVLSIIMNTGALYISLGLLALLLYALIGRHGHPGVANQYDESKCISCFIIYIALFLLTIPVPMI
ncbi:MAG: site-2 protease family protein [Desulfurococcaceae archaeon]